MIQQDLQWLVQQDPERWPLPHGLSGYTSSKAALKECVVQSAQGSSEPMPRLAWRMPLPLVFGTATDHCRQSLAPGRSSRHGDAGPVLEHFRPELHSVCISLKHMAESLNISSLRTARPAKPVLLSSGQTADFAHIYAAVRAVCSSCNAAQNDRLRCSRDMAASSAAGVKVLTSLLRLRGAGHMPQPSLEQQWSREMLDLHQQLSDYLLSRDLGDTIELILRQINTLLAGAAFVPG